MHTLSAFLVAAAAACAIARPSGPITAAKEPQLVPPRDHAFTPMFPARRYNNDFDLPPLIMPRFLGFEESPQILPPLVSEHDWLNKEIDRITKMEEEDETANPYGLKLASFVEPYNVPRPYDMPEREQPKQPYEPDTLTFIVRPPYSEKILIHREIYVTPHETAAEREERRKSFALTPLDEGYYEPEVKNKTQQSGGHHEGGESDNIILEPPRQIRQNPNLSRSKSLVAEDLDRLRTRLANKDYRLPVSLLPTNLRWLKLNHPKDDEESSPENTASTYKPHNNIHVVEAASDPADSIYGVALIAAVGTALAMTIVGFAFGWYTLSKKAKAAADVDYPAYGVTGPTMDMSGDRKLAHSAHMYHYQHQKQQIIAMERSGLEQRNGSVSDPESEEENEEGDYTVYECPGFATTGDMEVKNPMFSGDPTPATPGKCELVKPQPKE